PAAPAPPPTPASEELETEPEIAAEEAPVAEEPWIDTALCTSCNDCLDINPRLFVYDGNKQAVIGDPRAGTYDELVRAAEKCPARCIHPGTPLNPEEPNLEELIERAKPFNV
ncbi:MAG: ferredoxin, partial [Planctomycetota bacterium]